MVLGPGWSSIERGALSSRDGTGGRDPERILSRAWHGSGMELIRSTLSEERELHCPGQSNGSTRQGLFASWRVRLERKGLDTYYGVYTVALVCTLW